MSEQVAVGEELTGPAWDCPQHGTSKAEEQCCPRARALARLPKSQTLGGVPWASRVEVRHQLQMLHSEALETRAAMLHEDVPQAGTLEDLDRMIAGLVHCKRMLGWRPVRRLVWLEQVTPHVSVGVDDSLTPVLVTAEGFGPHWTISDVRGLQLAFDHAREYVAAREVVMADWRHDPAQGLAILARTFPGHQS